MDGIEFIQAIIYFTNYYLTVSSASYIAAELPIIVKA